MAKYDFYSTRYIEHQRSVRFAAQRITSVGIEIERIAGMIPNSNKKDFNFLIDIAELVLLARRAISFTYVMRFFLRGKNKQQFFDFQQKDLERSLEQLNKRNEQNWVDECD